MPTPEDIAQQLDITPDVVRDRLLAIGLDPTRSLVISQVILSFGIPFALVPLIVLTSRRDVMGEGFENHRLTTIVASIFAAIIIALNLFLLFQTFTGN